MLAAPPSSFISLTVDCGVDMLIKLTASQQYYSCNVFLLRICYRGASPRSERGPSLKPPANEMGRKIRQIRSSLKLTQKELSVRLGVRQATVSRWEAGTDIPSHSSLEEIARLGGVSVSNLLDVRQLGMVRVIGVAQATGLVRPADSAEWAERPMGEIGELEAVRVDCDELYPYDRDSIFYVAKNRDGVPESCLSPKARSLIETVQGDLYVCRLIRGEKEYTVLHYSGGMPLKQNVSLKWASRITWVKMP